MQPSVFMPPLVASLPAPSSLCLFFPLRTSLPLPLHLRTHLRREGQSLRRSKRPSHRRVFACKTTFMGGPKVQDSLALQSDPSTIRCLFVPIRLNGSQSEGGKSRNPDGASSVMSELLISVPSPLSPREGGPHSVDLDSKTNVLIVPGNPGVVMYYEEYVRSLRQDLGSEEVGPIVCLCHAGHSTVASGFPGPGLFSLQEQVDHKVEFLSHAQEYLNAASESAESAGSQGKWGSGSWEQQKRPQQRWIIIGHSIGAYISLGIQKHFLQQGGGSDGVPPISLKLPVIGLYPFLSLNKKSLEQRTLGFLAHLSLLCIVTAFIASFLRKFLPAALMRGVLKSALGKSWSPAAIAATQSCLLQYHVLRNYAYMGKTEFDYFERTPFDWDWLKDHSDLCTFVFGQSDHWGPVHAYQEMLRRLPEMQVVLDDEGHPHSFCCSRASSVGVAKMTSLLCRKYLTAAAPNGTVQ